MNIIIYNPLFYASTKFFTSRMEQYYMKIFTVVAMVIFLCACSSIPSNEPKEIVMTQSSEYIFSGEIVTENSSVISFDFTKRALETRFAITSPTEIADIVMTFADGQMTVMYEDILLTYEQSAVPEQSIPNIIYQIFALPMTEQATEKIDEYDVYSGAIGLIEYKIYRDTTGAPVMIYVPSLETKVNISNFEVIS